MLLVFIIFIPILLIGIYGAYKIKQTGVLNASDLHENMMISGLIFGIIGLFAGIIVTASSTTSLEGMVNANAQTYLLCEDVQAVDITNPVHIDAQQECLSSIEYLLDNQEKIQTRCLYRPSWYFWPLIYQYQNSACNAVEIYELVDFESEED